MCVHNTVESGHYLYCCADCGPYPGGVKTGELVHTSQSQVVKIDEFYELSRTCVPQLHLKTAWVCLHWRLLVLLKGFGIFLVVLVAGSRRIWEVLHVQEMVPTQPGEGVFELVLWLEVEVFGGFGKYFMLRIWCPHNRVRGFSNWFCDSVKHYLVLRGDTTCV